MITALWSQNGPQPVELEVAASSTALPRITLLGVPVRAGKESKERVLSACHQSGITFPHAKVTLSFHSPHQIQDVASLELALAVGLLSVHRQIPAQTYCVLGSLQLDGCLTPVPGHYAGLALLAEHTSLPIWTPLVSWPPDLALSWKKRLHSAPHLTELLAGFRGTKIRKAKEPAHPLAQPPALSHLPSRISPSLMNCLRLVLVGGHHCLLLGTPGMGKTYAKVVMQTLLPPLSAEEALERQLTLPLATWQPEEERFLLPSSHLTRTQLLGANQRTGVRQWLHHGVLFMDELPTWRTDSLLALRHILDTTTAPVDQKHQMLACCCFATANPCPCGFWGLPTCRCQEKDIERYWQRFSGALEDRFDLVWRVTEQDTQPFSLADWQEQWDIIIAARNRQRARRQQGFPPYARQYTWEQLQQLAPEALIKQWEKAKRHLSWRKLLQRARVAVTIADIAQSELNQEHFTLAGLFTQPVDGDFTAPKP